MFKKSTKETLALKDLLEKAGLEVIAEAYDGYKHVDLKIPKSRIEIEIDGFQHLTNPNQIISDIKREHYSDVAGYSTIHIPNELIRSDLGAIASAIAEAAKIREEQIKSKNQS